MRQIIYNGAMGPNINAGGIPFTAGESVAVADDAIADALLAKPHFSETPDVTTQAPAKNVKVTVEPITAANP
jgi:hypothetical protein